MRRLAFLLRDIIGNVKINQLPVKVRKIREDIIVKLERIDINLLHAIALSLPSLQLHREMGKILPWRRDLDPLWHGNRCYYRDDHKERGAQVRPGYWAILNLGILRCRCGKLQAENFLQRAAIGPYPDQNPHFNDKHRGTGHKYHPPLEIEEKSLGHGWAPILHHDTDDAYAETVHQNSDRNR